LGGLGADQKMVKLNSSFALLKQGVVRAMQGAKMSDQDIKLAQTYVPDILDTPDTIRTKLQQLDEFLTGIMQE